MKQYLVATLAAVVLGSLLIVPAAANPIAGTLMAPAGSLYGRAASQTSAAPAQKVEGKKDEDCGCEGEKPPADAMALVNGIKITTKEVEEPLKANVQELYQQVIEGRRHELDLAVNWKLYEFEARKRGVSTNQLLDQEVMRKVTDPTEAEARALYEQNKAQIQGDYNQLKPQLLDYLRAQRQSQVATTFANKLKTSYPTKILVVEVTAPTNAAERARVLATVNGENITSGDIEDNLRPLVYSVQDQVYNLRKKELDLRINDVLLQQEALKRQVTPAALLATEVTVKVKPIGDSEAKDFYDKNIERIPGDFAHTKESIVRYLQSIEEQSAAEVFAQQLRKQATVKIFLTPPVPPTYEIATANKPAKGPSTAAITLIEFTDFECPMCSRVHPILEQLTTEYSGKLRVVARYFPLEQHRYASKAAEAAEAAREQGKYWEYADILFKNQTALGVDQLKQYASQIGLDRTKFDAALDSGKYAPVVQQDLNDGTKVGVNSTPSVFVNGRMVQDRTYEGIKAAIDSALKGSSAGK